MITAKLVRLFEDGFGTVGLLVVKKGEDILRLTTLELPWRGNRQRQSCIPDGEYPCKRSTTGRFKGYEVLNVPGRTNIEIHPFNMTGETEGCIGVGEYYRHDYRGQIWESSEALRRLLSFAGEEMMLLTITRLEL